MERFAKTKRMLLPALLGTGLGFAGLMGYQQPAEAVFGCHLRMFVANNYCGLCENEWDGYEGCTFDFHTEHGTLCIPTGGECSNYI
jgi:hypothetical protein